MLITSLENFKIKYLKKLQVKKYRDQEDYFLVEGIDIVKEAEKSGYLEEVIMLENNKFSFNVKTTFINQKIADKLTKIKTSDFVFGLCRKKNKNIIGKKIFFLDNVQDPKNVGAIIRSAVAFNFDTIILRNCCDIYNEKAIRASKGMFFYLNIVKTDNLNELKELQKNDYQIIGTESNLKELTKPIVKEENFVIIMGNEGQGLSEDIKKLIEAYLTIPINEKCESLNVAIAASIIMYQINKRVMK